MPQFSEQNEPQKPQLAPKVESSAGGGSGGLIKTAIGMFDANNGFNPQLLTEEPPFWFHIKRRKVFKHFRSCFSKMLPDRALQIMERCGFPPLCILTISTRWHLLNDREFDVLDLQAVFETAGYDVSEFGKMLSDVENKCLYRLDKSLGLMSKEMLAHADVREFAYYERPNRSSESR